MRKNAFFRTGLSALLATGIAVVLLNLTFLLFVGFSSIFKTVPTENNMPTVRLTNTPIRLVLFSMVIILISWFVFRSKLNLYFKAAFLTVPIAICLIFIGIILSQSPILS